MRRACWLILWGAVGLFCRVAAGQEAWGRPRAVVVVQGPEDEELLSRLHGQTVDIEVALVAERADGERRLPTGPEEQVAAARELALARGARVVVWVRRPQAGQAGETEVCVAEVPMAGAGAGGKTVLVRRVRSVRAASAPGARSAAAEEIALVVRSALRALLRAAAVTAVPVAAVVPPVRAQAPASPPRQRAPAPRLGWHLGLGWQVVADGQSPYGQHGLAVRGGLDRGAFFGELAVAAGLPAVLADDYTAVSLSRHSVGLFGAYRLRLPRRWALAAGAAAGVLLFYRATEGLRPDVTPTPARVTPAFFVSPEARVLLRPALSLGLWLELSLAADVVVGAPELGYQGPDGFASRNQLWPVQPRLGLAVVYWRS